MQKVKITADSLKSKLVKGECKFTYKKLDGTLREARGTTKIDNIPEDLKPKGDNTALRVSYYDIDANGWRSIAEDQDILMDPMDMMDSYVTPNLSEEEITLMIWVHGSLEDEWLNNFIGLVVWQTARRVSRWFDTTHTTTVVIYGNRRIAHQIIFDFSLWTLPTKTICVRQLVPI